MPKFNIIVTRDTTESCTLEIEAEDQDQAEGIALEMARGDDPLDWAQDETPNISKEVYITNCDED